MKKRKPGRPKGSKNKIIVAAKETFDDTKLNDLTWNATHFAEPPATYLDTLMSQLETEINRVLKKLQEKF